MKAILKITTLGMCLTLLQAHNMHASFSFNEDFEREFTERMDHLEKSIKNTETQLKESFNKLFHNLNSEIKSSLDYANQPDFMGNQNYIKHYQQTSSSLSFANNDKAIKIMEQKDNNTKTYTIIVTDKTIDETAMQESSNKPSDMVIELKELESYIQKTFQSKPAEKILEECITAMKEEHKDSLMNIASSVNGNQKKYTVEIAHKKEPVADAAPTKKNKKNKKANS